MDKVEKAVIDLCGKWPESGYIEGTLIICRNGTASFMEGSYQLVYRASNVDPLHWEVICTYPEFMEARKRLKNKPSWDGAPDWAGWLAQDSDGRWFWASSEPVHFTVSPDTEWDVSGCGRLAWATDIGHVFGDWRQSLEPRPQPDNKEGVEWEPGVDLPPQGQKVDIEGESLVYGHGESGEVIGHIEKTAIVRMSYGLGCFTAEVLKPAKSHRDKVIEAAEMVWQYSGSRCTHESFITLAGDLYERGMLKLPGDEQLSGKETYHDKLFQALSKAVMQAGDWDMESGELYPAQEPWVREAESLLDEIEGNQ